MDHPYLEVRNLIHEYDGKRVLSISRLEIYPGEIFAVIGPNGAGKSTLLRILNLLEKPSCGEIVVGGVLVGPSTNTLLLRRKMVMVFQEPLLFNSTVFENIAYGLRVRKYSRAEIERRVNQFLAKFDIHHLSGHHALRLSGGEAQRVSLARALVFEPEVLLLDEPFASLDTPTKEALSEDLERVIREMKLTTVYVTHDRTEALTFADRMAVMDKGEILQIGTPEEIFNSPVNERVADFVGVETILSGTVVSVQDGLAEVDVMGERVQTVCSSSVGEKVFLCIRPEHVTLQGTKSTRQRGEGEWQEAISSARNRFVGTVTKVIPRGAIVKVCLDCGFPLVSFVTKQSAEELELKEGRIVSVSFKATAVHAIKK
ncbi:MAG: ABC transporter ATP-binding protein [Chloroflexi bacterium]|nr:ABC transporter ATP-binding protein [Chloroflexota bacterium]